MSPHLCGEVGGCAADLPRHKPGRSRATEPRQGGWSGGAFNKAPIRPADDLSPFVDSELTRRRALRSRPAEPVNEGEDVVKRHREQLARRDSVPSMPEMPIGA